MYLAFQPLPGAPFDVWRRVIFGDHSLVTFCFRHPKGLEPILVQTVRREKTLAPANRRLHGAAPRGEWLRTQVTPVLVKAIEDRIEGRNLTFLEKLKAGDLAVIEGDDLAVEEQCAIEKLGDGGCDVRVCLVAVLAVSGQQADAGPFLIGEDSKAVVFLLIDPAGRVEWLRNERCQHGLDAKWNLVGHNVRFLRTAWAGFALPARLPFPAGSPIEARSMSPPPSRAISARSRWLATERGSSTVMSFVDAY